MNGRSSCVAPEVVYSGGGAGQALHAYEFLEHADNALALNLCLTLPMQELDEMYYLKYKPLSFLAFHYCPLSVHEI